MLYFLVLMSVLCLYKTCVYHLNSVAKYLSTKVLKYILKYFLST